MGYLTSLDLCPACRMGIMVVITHQVAVRSLCNNLGRAVGTPVLALGIESVLVIGVWATHACR